MKPLKIFIFSLILLVAFFLIGSQTLTVILAEYRRENPLIPIKTLHKMTEKQVKKEMSRVGLTWEKTEENLPQQHLIFFRKA